MLNKIIRRIKLILKVYHDKKERMVKFGKNVKTDLASKFEGESYFYENCQIFESFIGYGTCIGLNAFINKAKIGRFCSIGPNFMIAVGRHPVRDFISTHPAFYSTRKQAGFTFVKQQWFEEIKFVNKNYVVEIGSDVFIGVNVTILDGVTVGHGAVIAAGTTVYKDVEPYAIYAGSPMRLVRYRFSKDVIDKLIAIKWWDMPINRIKEMAPFFDSPEHFFYQENINKR